MLLDGYQAFFDSLNSRGIDYCLVGGLAVILHAYVNGFKTMRSTRDADIMFDSRYTNADFARNYISVFGSDPNTVKALYESMFGADAFESLSEPEQALVNTSFLGIAIGAQDHTPDFDVARSLNGFDLKSLEREVISYKGTEIRVATINQLLVMKKRTQELLHASLDSNSRPQDLIDIRALEMILNEKKEDSKEADRECDDGPHR